MMKRIWAPWRMTYIQGEAAEPDCPFCSRLTQEDGPENLILYRGEHCFVILNRYPYTNGHLMVVPFAHKPSIENLDSETLSEMMCLAKRALTVLRNVYGAQSFNVGINIGEAAGAGVTDHIHLHVVPRWGGDTNFMSSTANTRVLPETLEDTFRKLQTGWQAMI
jgi:ATP adenylyltransferase